eukprot:Nk52_evm3s373 gene=Nk52_evmTU3s373
MANSGMIVESQPQISTGMAQQQMPDLLPQLSSVDMISIDQELSLAEVCCAGQARNIFHVQFKARNHGLVDQWRTHEESECCDRFCCKRNRAYSLPYTANSVGGGRIVTYSRPNCVNDAVSCCCWPSCSCCCRSPYDSKSRGRQMLVVSSPDSTQVFARIFQPYSNSCCSRLCSSSASESPVLQVRGEGPSPKEDGPVLLSVFGPSCVICGCCGEYEYSLRAGSGPEGVEVGRLKKRYRDVFTEWCSGATSFDMEMNQSQPGVIKAFGIGVVMALEYMFFERTD